MSDDARERLPDLADLLVDTLHDLRQARADVAVYRSMAQEGIDLLHDALDRERRLRAQHQHVIDELRELRARIMRADVAA